MRQVRFVFAATLAATAFSACATKGFVRKNIETNRVAMAGQLSNEKSERTSADDAIRSDVSRNTTDIAKVSADLAALRGELQSMRTEFGAKISTMEGQVSFAFPVHFDFNNATVRPVDQAALEKFATVASKYYHGAQITVEGFADPSGSASYNLRLSKHRADAVRDFIATKGIDGHQREDRRVRRDPPCEEGRKEHGCRCGAQSSRDVRGRNTGRDDRSSSHSCRIVAAVGSPASSCVCSCSMISRRRSDWSAFVRSTVVHLLRKAPCAPIH